MPINHYQLLKLSQDATQDEIKQVYLVTLEKWQKLKEQQPDQLKERTDKVIAALKTAYQVLSDPAQRARYDKTLTQATTITTMSTGQANNVKTSPYKFFYIIIILLLIVMITGIGYLIYQNHLTISSQVQQESAKQTTQSQATPTPNAVPAELQAAIKKVQEQQKQQAEDPALQALAQAIAKDSNKNINAIINYNTRFIDAQASKQNIIFRFLVMDGISISKILLTAYFNERFILDNNEVCNGQQANLAKGILYTFAYYTSKGELLTSYYIDQQVCQSPASSKIIKRPDINQLPAIDLSSEHNQQKTN